MAKAVASVTGPAERWGLLLFVLHDILEQIPSNGAGREVTLARQEFLSSATVGVSHS